MILLDAFAIVEILLGTNIGREIVAKIKKDDFRFLTTNLAEFIAFCEKNKLSHEEIVESLLFNIMPIDFDIATHAGKLYKRARLKSSNIGMIDVILLAAAEKLNAKLITGDSDFQGFENIIFVKD